MIFESCFNFGDIVYAATGKGVNGPLTIGKISIEQTDSPGIEGETLFDNYKPQQSYEETYMCIETGIGCGYVFKKENLFTSPEDAALRINEINQ